MSAMVGAPATELTEYVVGGGVSIVHSLLSYLVPCIINCLLKNM